MKILFLIGLAFCRYVVLEPKEVFTFKDKATKDTMYKFIYRAFDSSNVGVAVYDPNMFKITTSDDPYGVIYTKLNSDGFITIRVTNPTKQTMKFGYKCPDVDKELQGPLGPIKDVDSVGELQSCLENIIKTQRTHIKKYQKHTEMLDRSRKWVFKLVLLEIVSSAAIMYYLHKSTLDMFNKKKVQQ
ncbi:hypothetical protein NGRA_0736 [Nosema granulosis]|uniref:GOLD domain-containing protein n=1 Tax=Nosema granulosis TaxID=83296 RepID=A0A9P6H0A8_9MICR|nr:hypothetical protein NGRA_0736 [Nosema granulosis]